MIDLFDGLHRDVALDGAPFAGRFRGGAGPAVGTVLPRGGYASSQVFELWPCLTGGPCRFASKVPVVRTGQACRGAVPVSNESRPRVRVAHGTGCGAGATLGVWVR